MSEEDVARALQTATYNESVQISVTDQEGNSHEISLVACLDEEHGGVQWNTIDDVGTVDANSGAALRRRHLRTKRWIFPMLNDHRRNELYEEAIERASDEISRRLLAVNNNGGEENDAPPDVKTVHCLDIGSGTGLLAMMSARSLNKRLSSNQQVMMIQVTSIEMSGAMAEIARETIASNQLDTCVHVVEGHSCEIPPLNNNPKNNKALLCTSELLESGLLGEGWIPAIRDAWERHLDPSALVVPRAAKVYAQVVEGEGVCNFWGPHQKLDGFPNENCLSLSLDGGDGKKVLLGGSSSDSTQGVQVPVHIDKLLQDASHPIRILSDPVEVLAIRLDSKDTIPSRDGQTHSTTFIPSASGVAHGVLFWWELDLFGDDLSYNTGPKMGPWQDHWQQCLYVFAKPSEELLRIEKGQPTTLQASQDDTSISFSILPGDESESKLMHKRLRTTYDEGTRSISPQRALQLNDLDRSKTIRDGVRTLLDQRGLDAVVLDLSDFSLCAIMAALLGASNVTSLEASSTDLPESTARIAQLSNKLPLPRRGSSAENNFQILRCRPEHLTVDILGGLAADVVVAEPYYEILEGWELQQALNFFHIIRGLKRRHVIRLDALVMPYYAKIMGCAFESSDIGNAYRPCDSRIRNFSHDVVNQYYTLSDHDTSLPSWQYEITQLSEAFEIGTLDYRSCTIDQEKIQQSVPFTRVGICHGILLWIDYGVPANLEGGMNTLSTRGRSYHQMIRLLHGSSIHNVKPADLFCCQTTIGKRSGHGDDFHFDLSIKRATTS
jgi:protein arginine N-methyltransferase 7